MILKEPIQTGCSHTCSAGCYDAPFDLTALTTNFPLKPFYFMRHGETEWNQQSLIQGCTDISLNEKGIEQAHLAAQKLKNIPIDNIISSPLQRALKTAEIAGQALGKPITIIDTLKNGCYGSIEGKSKHEHREAYTGWRTGYKIEHAEHYHCFTKRVFAGFQEALQYPGLTLIIAHGGVYWPIQDMLNLNASTIPNATPVLHLPPSQGQDTWIIKEL